MNYIKLGYNPFTIHNQMQNDRDYLNSLNYSNDSNLINDDECLDKRISLKDFFKVYKKSTLILFYLCLHLRSFQMCLCVSCEFIFY